MPDQILLINMSKFYKPVAVPLWLVTAHDRAVRSALSVMLGSALASNKSCKVARDTLVGLKTRQKFKENS